MKGSEAKYWQHRRNTSGTQVETYKELVSRWSFKVDWGNRVHPMQHQRFAGLDPQSAGEKKVVGSGLKPCTSTCASSGVSPTLTDDLRPPVGTNVFAGSTAGALPMCPVHWLKLCSTSVSQVLTCVLP
ncbi:hypothetical protein HAX54_032483 [Datura stramonium]|uniref:Uncharacterized protein n=1 Tax=Datura stramonium TaxID=4076 RepID=A0ABS8VC18_DATST|nr:hypothetical protein [Datura stramonium]